MYHWCKFENDATETKFPLKYGKPEKIGAVRVLRKGEGLGRWSLFNKTLAFHYMGG